MKLGRNYRLMVQAEPPSTDMVEIELPFTLTFNISRTVSSAINAAEITIFNLSEATRDRIFRDRFYNATYRKVTLDAGYDGEYTTIAEGNLYEAYSFRQGPDFVTRIVAHIGGHDAFTTKTYKTYDAGMTYKDFFKELIGEFKNLKLGTIGKFDGSFKRPVSVKGNTFQTLASYSDNSVFVDNGLVHVMKNNEVLAGTMLLIDSSTGLLETPQRSGSLLTLTTLFTPEVMLAQKVVLNSEVFKEVNGEHRVIGIQHEGIISEGVNGRCSTKLTLQLGNEYFGKLVQVGNNQ